MLLEFTQGAIDDHAGSSKVLCPKRHQSSIAGVNMRQELGDEDHGVFRDLINLGTGVSVYTYVYALCADCFRPGTNIVALHIRSVFVLLRNVFHSKGLAYGLRLARSIPGRVYVEALKEAAVFVTKLG